MSGQEVKVDAVYGVYKVDTGFTKWNGQSLVKDVYDASEQAIKTGTPEDKQKAIDLFNTWSQGINKDAHPAYLDESGHVRYPHPWLFKDHLKNGGKLIPKGQQGIKTINLPTVTVSEKNHALDLAHSQFPITKSLDIHTYYDPNFQPAKDLKNPNFGNIEYMTAKHNDLPYYNNYKKPIQYKDKSTIVYNNNLKDMTQEAIALDALSHGLREQDKDWKEYFLPNLTKAWSNNDYVLGDLNAGSDDPLGNAVDGNIRNLLVQDKYRPYMRYSPRQEIYNATVHTPEEKKAWGEAYDYITSNKLFPNGESLIVTPKGSYISK